MEQPVQLLERLLKECEIDPDVAGTDIWFLYFSNRRTFKGQAGADAESASVEFWLRHYPPKKGGEEELKTKLDSLNQSEVMVDGGVRWMRALFAHKHLGFVAQLNEPQKILNEAVGRRRLAALIKLIEAEVPNLIS